MGRHPNGGKPPAPGSFRGRGTPPTPPHSNAGKGPCDRTGILAGALTVFVWLIGGYRRGL